MFFVNCGDVIAGFRIQLENGWKISVQFGSGCYGSNHTGWEPDCFDWNDNLKCAEAQATSAEIWALHDSYDPDKKESLPTERERQNYYNAHHYPENPIGWQNSDEVVKFITTVSNLPLPSLRIIGFEARKNDTEEEEE